MPANNLWRSATETVCVLGVAATVGFSCTSPVASIDIVSKHHARDYIMSSTNTIYNNSMMNYYYANKKTRLSIEAQRLFGEMRDATAEEMISVSNYIRSISKKTGVNFFDLC